MLGRCLIMMFLLIGLPLNAMVSGLHGQVPRDKKVPHLEDETSLIRIKATPETAVGKTAIICGGVEIGDYYNFSYGNSEESHFSLKFKEAGETFGDISGESANLYFAKTRGQEAIEVLAKAAEKNKGGRVLKLARVKVTLVAGRFQSDKQWDMFEVLDMQFFDNAADKWLPWIVETQLESEKKLAAAKAEEARTRREEAVKAKLAAMKAQEKPPKSKEEAAAAKLKLAKSLLEKNETAGKKRLQEILDQFPDSTAAEEAGKILGKLKP